MASKEVTKPEFAWGRMGLLDQLRFAEMGTEMQQAQRARLELAALVTENPDQQVNEALVVRVKEANAVQREMVMLVGKFIKAVPEAWLVEDAPENIQWGDPQALNYIRPQYLIELTQAFATELQGTFEPGK